MVPLALAAVAACSAWIDEYEVSGPDGAADTSADVDTDTDADTDIDSDSDADTDTGTPQCGEMMTTPAGDETEFCHFDGGEFHMGCDDSYVEQESCAGNEVPAHRVALSEFHLQRYEVTNGDFAAFVGVRPEWAPGGASAEAQCTGSYLSEWEEGAPPPGKGELPVLEVCWHAARAYCQWLGGEYDLPTEAQWEGAARSGHDGHAEEYWIYPFGNAASCALANYDNCNGAPEDVGEAPGTPPSGVFDLAGNAWEWTLDWYRADYYCDPWDTGDYAEPDCDPSAVWEDPAGDPAGMVKTLRGGSWFHPAAMIRSAGRFGQAPSSGTDLIGFRCARTPHVSG
jgi:formylglycine-generating enzyme required for sulfatase activity